MPVCTESVRWNKYHCNFPTGSAGLEMYAEEWEEEALVACFSDERLEQHFFEAMSEIT